MSHLLPLFHNRLTKQGFSYIHNQELGETERFDYYEVRFSHLFKKPSTISNQFCSIQISTPAELQNGSVTKFKITLSSCLGTKNPELGQLIGGIEYSFITEDNFFESWDSVYSELNKLYDLSIYSHQNNN